MMFPSMKIVFLITLSPSVVVGGLDGGVEEEENEAEDSEEGAVRVDCPENDDDPEVEVEGKHLYV